MALGREDYLEQLITQRCNQIDRTLETNFRRINGRLTNAEDDISEARTKIAVLEDRGSRDNTARAQGLGSIIASAITMIYAWFKG